MLQLYVVIVQLMIRSLGKKKLNWICGNISTLFVINNFTEKRLTTESNELQSDSRNGHGSKPERNK